MVNDSKKEQNTSNRKHVEATLRRKVLFILLLFIAASTGITFIYLFFNIKDSYDDYCKESVNNMQGDLSAVISAFDETLDVYHNMDELYAVYCLSGEKTAYEAYSDINTIFNKLQGVAIMQNGAITDQYLNISPNSTFSFQRNTFGNDIISIAQSHQQDGTFFIARAYASTMKECRAVHIVHGSNGQAAAFVYSIDNTYNFVAGRSPETILNNRFQIYDTSSGKILPERYTPYNYESLLNEIKQGNNSGFQIQDRDTESNYYIAYAKSSVSNGYIVFTRNVEKYEAFYSAKLKDQGFILAGYICFFIIIAFSMKLWVLDSVITIENAVFDVVKGTVSKKFYMKKNNIFYPIAQTIDFLLNTITDMLNREYKANFLKKQAELSMLQSQINPHFLYNTLESIRALALRVGAYDVEKMTKSLSNMFRYTISCKELGVTIQEELANVDNYYTIQNYRFSGRFTYIKEFKENSPLLMNYYMPKMILQPLVENAIHHGLEPKIGKGEFSIRVIETKRKLLITVSDTGIGIPMQKLIETNAKLKKNRTTENQYLKGNINPVIHGGLALLNVNERILLYFGDEYGITLYSKEGLGTDVEVILPLIKNKDEFEEIIERLNTKYSREE